MKSVIKTLSEKLRKGEITAVELTEKYIEAIKRVNPVINAYVHETFEEARRDAEYADKLIKEGKGTPLTGIPFTLKDNIATDGELTTCCSKILEGFRPYYDATVWKKLKEQGAVLLGKTNMDEFAMGSTSETSVYGAPLNPRNKERVTGGSSGGVAAAVCADIAAYGLGSDTGGSIRQPASFCGIVGFKPTYGAVSRYGLIAYGSSLDQIGPMTHSVTDAALIYDAIKGEDSADQTSAPVHMGPTVLNGDVKGIKIGVAKEFFPTALNGTIKAALEKVIKFYEDNGAEIVETSIGSFDMALACYYILSSAEATSNLSRYDGIKYGKRAEDCKTLDDIYYRSRTEFFGAEVKRRIMLGNFVLSSGYYDAFYLRASKARTLIKKDFENALSGCDALICPTAPTTAYKLGSNAGDTTAAYLGDVFTVPVNIAGLPALSVNCGHDNDGLPIGMQLIGKPYCEKTLLSLAEIYEKGGRE